MKQSEKLVNAFKPFFVLYLLAILIILAVYSSRFGEKPVPAEGHIMMDAWTMETPDGRTLTTGSSYRNEGYVTGTFTMTSQLPGELREGMYFCVVVGGDTAVYIDGELRKDFIASRDIRLPGGCVKRFYMLTPLSPADAGKSITISRIGTTRRGAVYQDALVATYPGIYAFLMNRYGLSFMLSEILFIFSFVIVLISIAMRIRYRQRIEMLYGAMAILVISAWLITNSYLYPFAYGSYHIDGIVNYLLCLLMPFNLIFYVDALQRGRYRRVMEIVLLIGLVNALIWPTLHFTGVFLFPDALLYMDLILGVLVLISMGVLIADTLRGRAKEYAYMAVGFAGFLICCISEIVILNFVPIMQDDIPMLVGLAFMLTLSVIQQMHDLKKVREEAIRAMDLSEAKTRFLASMSHEIRTPINAVLGMNEMILRENKDPGIEEYAKSVKSSGQMLLMLVNDVLDFSKIEAGKMEIGSAPYHLSELLSGIMPMLKERAGEKNLQLRTVITEWVPDGQISDEFRIRQILINLIGNAIKYTDAGSVILTVGGEAQPDGTFLLTFSVRDTGRGISEEGQKHLFEAFTRADLKKNGTIEGTGLGLAIVKRILDAMGGEIRVSSALGEGSEFFVRIPVGVSEEVPLREDFMERSEADPGSVKGCDYQAPDARLLVVDDNSSNLKLVRLLLKRAGIEPDTCDSGAGALERCREKVYDLILLDHMMPEMDGIETLKRIRGGETENRSVPAVVLTANAVAGSRQLYLDAGFSDYLTKPIDPAVLERTVKKYLPAEKIRPADQEDKKTGPKTLREVLASVEGLDPETALRNTGGEESLLREVLQDIAAECDGDIETMRTALAAGDLKDYAYTAHAVKGLMATIGYPALSERAKRHEFAAKDGDISFLQQDGEGFFAAYRGFCGLVKDM